MLFKRENFENIIGGKTVLLYDGLTYNTFIFKKLSSLLVRKGFKSINKKIVYKAFEKLKFKFFFTPAIVWKFFINRRVSNSYFFKRLFNLKKPISIKKKVKKKSKIINKLKFKKVKKIKSLTFVIKKFIKKIFANKFNVLGGFTYFKTKTVSLKYLSLKNIKSFKKERVKKRIYFNGFFFLMNSDIRASFFLTHFKDYIQYNIKNQPPVKKYRKLFNKSGIVYYIKKSKLKSIHKVNNFSKFNFSYETLYNNNEQISNINFNNIMMDAHLLENRFTHILYISKFIFDIDINSIVNDIVEFFTPFYKYKKKKNLLLLKRGYEERSFPFEEKKFLGYKMMIKSFKKNLKSTDAKNFEKEIIYNMSSLINKSHPAYPQISFFDKKVKDCSWTLNHYRW